MLELPLQSLGLVMTLLASKRYNITTKTYTELNSQTMIQMIAFPQYLRSKQRE